MHKQKNESHREKGKNMITFVSRSRRMTMEQAGVSETKKKTPKKTKTIILPISDNGYKSSTRVQYFFLLTKICFAQHDTIQPEITRALLVEIFVLPKPCL